LKRCKRFTALTALILALCTLLTACNKDKAPEYRDDVETSEIAGAIKQKIEGGDKLTKIEEASFIQNTMGFDPNEYEDFSVFITVVGTSINEFGIFKAKDSAQADELKEKLQGYLKLRNDAWMPEYLPEEYPKLKNAEIKSAGLYVMYAILSESDKEAAFKELENMLAK